MARAVGAEIEELDDGVLKAIVGDGDGEAVIDTGSGTVSIRRGGG